LQEDESCDDNSIISVTKLFCDEEMIIPEMKKNQDILSAYVECIEYNNVLFLTRLKEAKRNIDIL